MADGATPPHAHAVAHGLREALATFRHADMLFDMATHLLGDEALVHATPDGKVRWLFRRIAPSSDEVLPWPLLTLSQHPQLILDLGLPTFEVPRRDVTPPKLRGLKPGHVIVHDGLDSLQVTYREDGVWKETSRRGPPQALVGVLAALARQDATPPERVADFVVANDIGRHGPGRLRLPVALPVGPAGAWARGVRALREALHTRKLPSEPGWLVADGLDGTALAHGPTRDDALAAWRVAVERRQPRPPRPTTSGPLLPPDTEPWSSEAEEIARAYKQFEEAAARHKADWPEPTPDTTPAVIVPVEPCPLPAHPWGRWMRALGPHGESIYALQRFYPNGFTLVAPDVIDRVDLDHLETLLDDIDEAMPSSPHAEGEAWKGEAEPYPCGTVTYHVEAGPAGAAARIRFAQSSRSATFDAGSLLDGSRLIGCIVRHRWM